MGPLRLAHELGRSAGASWLMLLHGVSHRMMERQHSRSPAVACPNQDFGPIPLEFAIWGEQPGRRIRNRLEPKGWRIWDAVQGTYSFMRTQ